MDVWSWVERGYAASRLALGTTVLVAPGVAAPWLGAAARDADARSAVRLFGARDVVLGAMAWLGAPEPGARRRAAALCALADAADAVVAAGDLRRTRRPGAALALAAALGGTATGAVLAARADG